MLSDEVVTAVDSVRGVARLAVCSDVDGTLAPIVEDPAAAVLLDGVHDALAALAARPGVAVVAVVSGRPAAFLAPKVPPGVVVSGLYGLERVEGGEVRVRPDAEAWRPVVVAAADAAEAELPAAVGVERKGVSLTLHTRAAPEHDDVVQAWARDRAAATGLEARPAKRSVELHPPVEADKGTAVRDLVAVAAAEGVVFLGDDVGDLPALAALAGLRADGLATLAVAVAGPETPAEVLAAADVAVDGPPGALEVLRLLAGRP